MSAAFGVPMAVAVGVGLVVAAGGGVYWAMQRLESADQDFERMNKEFDDYFANKSAITDQDLEKWAKDRKFFKSEESGWSTVCREVTTKVQRLGQKAEETIKSYCDKKVIKNADNAPK